VMVRLEGNVRALKKSGCAAWRADVVGARILAAPPPGPTELAVQLERYREKHHKALKPGGRRAALMLRIPSAVSLRLDTMVTAVRETGLAAYRHEMIGVLILEHEPKGAQALVDRFNEYRQARVEDLVAPEASISDLLEVVPPEQGPRPR